MNFTFTYRQLAAFILWVGRALEVVPMHDEEARKMLTALVAVYQSEADDTQVNGEERG